MARITSAKRMSDEAEKREHRGMPKTSVSSCCSVRGRAIRNNAIRVQCVFKYAGDLRKQRAEHNCTGDAPALDSGARARSSARYADCCDACARGAGASIGFRNGIRLGSDRRSGGNVAAVSSVGSRCVSGICNGKWIYIALPSENTAKLRNFGCTLGTVPLAGAFGYGSSGGSSYI